MKHVFRNWKTSLLGTGVLSAGLTQIINYPDQWKEGAVLMAMGLIGLIAKDSNVSGKPDQ